MKKYLKCKVCGFIGQEGAIKKVCPACGAPITAFESYEYKMSEKRLKILKMDIHPILVHFPQSLAFLSLVFIVAAFFSQGEIRGDIITTEKILSILLPITVLIAMVGGTIDAKTRFKERFGPLIKQKIVLSSILLATSIITAILFNQEAFSALGMASIIILSIVCFTCSFLIGKKGSNLDDAKLSD